MAESNRQRIATNQSANKRKSTPTPNRLNLLNLEKGVLEQADVARTFGFVDLYRDFGAAEPQQHELEKRLASLESQAGEIFSKITRMYDAGKEEVQITRGAKDLLRRFLFLMLYRNLAFADRYDKSAADYDSNDRDDMLAYMKEKGFDRPRDVWFSNIRAFLDIDLARSSEAVEEDLIQRAFPADALWFVKNMYMYTLTLCTPNVDLDEFLLTQNAYAIFEGPNNPGAWTDFHIFAPVSAKIMIVLRQNFLPSTLEEDKDYEAAKLEVLELCESRHPENSLQGSCLEEVPVTKPRNNYSRFVNGKVELLPTKISMDKHVFYFRFFKLETKHVQRINEILLQEAIGTISIVYKSPIGLRRALEFYLADEGPGFKKIYRSPVGQPDKTQFVLKGDGQWSNTGPEDGRLPYLKLLEKIAQGLGSAVKAKYTVVDPITLAPPPSLAPKQQDRYEALGGTRWGLANDLDQARRIVQLVIKSDSMLRWATIDTKLVAHRKREDLISTLPARRVWLFVKHLRVLSRLDPWTTFRPFDRPVDNEGIEDAFVDAYHVFKPNASSRIIYRSFGLKIFLDLSPDIGLAQGWAPGVLGTQRLQTEMAIVFGSKQKLSIGLSVAWRSPTGFSLHIGFQVSFRRQSDMNCGMAKQPLFPAKILAS